MREITLGGQPVDVSASPFTLYIYNQEFGPQADLISDLMSFTGGPQEARFVAFFQILWAMCKTAKSGAQFPGFEDWLRAHEDLDIGDKVIWEAVLEEISRGLLGDAAAKAAAREAQDDINSMIT